MPEMNETEKRSYILSIIMLRILAVAAILFVLFILYMMFLDSAIYTGIVRNKALKTIKAADAAYINIDDTKKKVSVDDFEMLQSIFQTIEIDAECDGRYVKWGCGFSDNFSIEFVDNDTAKSVFIDKAHDGCGGYTIDYNIVFFSDRDKYGKISDITEKYGMGEEFH